MYEWIWRRMPGSSATRAMWMVLIAVALAAMLWFLVFPWVTGFLPVDQV